MQKTVVISTNDNPDYLSYLPYVQEAWNKLGWDTITFYMGHGKVYRNGERNLLATLNPSKRYRQETMVQCARLFGAKYLDGLLMTADVDMIPLSDYWQPDSNKITCYGYDLTGKSQIPMCYVAMDASKWNEMIPEKTIEELLDKYPKASSEKWEDWWSVDQQILTERIKKRNWVSVERGFTKGLAKGRIDRHDWDGTINSSDEKIDAHMLRPYNLEQTERVMKMIKL